MGSPRKLNMTNPLFSKLYSMHLATTKMIKLPLVDDAINSLASTSVLPMDADGLPKNSCDRHIEQTRHRDFEAAAMSVRASATVSLFARAAYTWASDLTSSEADIPKDLKDEIKDCPCSGLCCRCITWCIPDVSQAHGRSIVWQSGETHGLRTRKLTPLPKQK